MKKIRVWSRKDKKFLSINVDNYQLVYQGDIWIATKREYSISPDFTNFEKVYIVSDNPDFVMQDFTGKLDRFDKQIYEGDIVQTSFVSEFGDGRLWYGHYEEVVWVKQEARFGLKEYRQWGSDRGHLPHNPYEIKVVGNIFENPELLKS